ncbi:hypothetical protein Tco_0536736, partial [Tanacetum coccineum]
MDLPPLPCVQSLSLESTQYLPPSRVDKALLLALEETSKSTYRVFCNLEGILERKIHVIWAHFGRKDNGQGLRATPTSLKIMFSAARDEKSLITRDAVKFHNLDGVQGFRHKNGMHCMATELDDDTINKFIRQVEFYFNDLDQVGLHIREGDRHDL